MSRRTFAKGTKAPTLNSQAIGESVIRQRGAFYFEGKGIEA